MKQGIYIYIYTHTHTHVSVSHSVSIYEAECSCHFLPSHSGKMIQVGALTMVAIRTIHIRVHICNSVLNTGYCSICWKQHLPLKVFTQLCLTLCEVLVIVLEDGFTCCWLPFFLYELYVNVVLRECFGENSNFPVLGFKAQEVFILKKSILFGTSRQETCKNILCAYWINHRQDRVELQNSPEKNVADHSLKGYLVTEEYVIVFDQQIYVVLL